MNDYKSTSGYQIGGTAITWKSKKQSCVALSTAEAEYMSLAGATQEAIWLRQLLSDLKRYPSKATQIYEDNQSTIYMAKNPQFHGRSKHIGIKYHYVREQVKEGNMKIVYCPTGEMVADILTKGVSFEKFSRFQGMCGMKASKESNMSASEKE